jgi:hypothetical protein
MQSTAGLRIHLQLWQTIKFQALMESSVKHFSFRDFLSNICSWKKSFCVLNGEWKWLARLLTGTVRSNEEESEVFWS